MARSAEALLEEGSWISRRVSTASVLAVSGTTLTIERKISLSLDHGKLAAYRARVKPCCNGETLVPLGLFRKDLILDFDVRDESGGAMLALSRMYESQVAQELVLLAARNSEVHDLKEPSSRIKDLVLSYVSSISPNPDETFEEFADKWLHSSEGRQSSPADRMWVRSAGRNIEVRHWLTVLRHHHVLITLADLSRDRVLKVRRAEITSRRREARRPPRVAARVEIDLPDFGWPRSDHFRLIAPEGTVYTGPFLRPIADRDNASLKFILRGRPARLALYNFNNARSTPRHVRFSALLWPARKGATQPVALMALGVIVLLLGGASWDFYTQLATCAGGPLVGMRQFIGASELQLQNCESPLLSLPSIGGLDAAVSLGFAALTILLLYMLREGEPTVRRALLYRWRVTAAWLAPFPWVAAVLLLTPRSIVPVGFYWACWTALGLVAVLFAIPVWRVYFHLTPLRLILRPGKKWPSNTLFAVVNIASIDRENLPSGKES